MNNIIEWMIENKIAENNFSAAHIANGLKLAGLDPAEQEARCRLYRAWRPKTDKKNDIPPWQAYELAIAGIDPRDIQERQIMFSEHTCMYCGESLPTIEIAMEHAGQCSVMREEPQTPDLDDEWQEVI